MSDRNFMDMIRAKWAEGKFLCVGLDSDVKKIPEDVNRDSNAKKIVKFNWSIIHATKDLVCAYKPNSAFYEAHGSEGIEALRETVNIVKDLAPDVPIIADCKRGDIGNTNQGSAEFAFDYLGTDAVTVSPYLGIGALKPFLVRKDKGIFIICRTSNPEAAEFQDLFVDNPAFVVDTRQLPSREAAYRCRPSVYLFEHVAWRVATQWNTNNNCCLVFGATNPEQLKAGRAIVGDMPLLLPGIGAQGAEIKATVEAGKDSKGTGIIINASRSIIFASSGHDYAEAARREAERLHNEVQGFLHPEKGAV